MALILNLPQELWGIIFDYMLEYTMNKADITRQSCRDLQNLRLSHRSFANEHAVNHLLFRSILLRISKHSCERLKATHQRIGQYVQRLIIEPSQFMVIQSFREYRVLLTAHHDASRHCDRQSVSIPSTWDKIEATEQELLAGYAAYKQRQEEDELAVELLRDNAQRIYSSFTNVHSIDVFKSWDDGGPSAQRIFTLMPLGFAGFLHRESIKAQSWDGPQLRRVGLVYGGLLDEVMFRYSCLNIIRTTWTVLPYLLRFIRGEFHVNLGDNISFQTGDGPRNLPSNPFADRRLRKASMQIEAKSISVPVYGSAGSDAEDIRKFKCTVDRNLVRSALAFLSHICILIEIASLRIQRPEGTQSAPRQLAGRKHLNAVASQLQELIIEKRIVRTDSLFHFLGQARSDSLRKITFRDCVLLYGTVCSEKAFLRLIEKASNLRTATGTAEVTIERSRGYEGFRQLYSTRDKYVHDPGSYRKLAGWHNWPRHDRPDEEEDELSPWTDEGDGGRLFMVM